MEGIGGGLERSWPGHGGVFLVCAAAVCLEIAPAWIFSVTPRFAACCRLAAGALFFSVARPHDARPGEP